MADVRTFDPSNGNPIAQALRAAMGEPVRPVTPGERPRSATAASPTEPASTWVSVTVTKDA